MTDIERFALDLMWSTVDRPIRSQVRMALHREGVEIWLSPPTSYTPLGASLLVSQDASLREVWAQLEARGT